MILDRFRLDGKAAVVTGAGRGIGAAIAIAFAQAGADVALAARTKEQLDEVAGRVEAVGRRAVVVPTDVTDHSQIERLVEEAVGELGRLDIVVNNAGGTMPRAFLDTSPGFLERSFGFNVTSAFLLTKLATPHLLNSGEGAVVNISSVIGRVADRGFVAYGTAKGALAHMTRLIAQDLAPRVRVNAIAVGSIGTSALEVVLTDDDLRAQMEGNTPLRRIGEPEEIAAAALFLASPAGSYTTGQVLGVDGGLQTGNLSLGLPDLEP